MNKVLYIILISLFSLTILSCAKKSSTSSSSTTDNTTTVTENTTTVYDGTYNSVCPSNEKRKYTRVFSGTNMKLITKDYNEDGCSTREGEHVSYTTFTLGDNVTVTKNSDNSSVSAQKITITKTKHTYMFMKDDDTNSANSASSCGFSDWEITVAIDVNS